MAYGETHVQPADSETRIRADIVEIGRRCWMQGWCAANDGNISVRLGPDEFIATPTGLAKGFLSPDQLCKVNLKGELIEGSLKPSSEITMHLECYRQRPDIGAVVHAHPPTATGFAVAGMSLESCLLPEVVIVLGGVPLAPYGTPGGMEIPESIRPYLPNHDAFLLANHGCLSIGKDLFTAYYRMETTELFAKIALTARLLGGERVLPPEEVAKLEEQRSKFGVATGGHCIDACASGAPEMRDRHRDGRTTCYAETVSGAPASARSGSPTEEPARRDTIDIDTIVEEVVRQVRALQSS